MKKQRTQLPEIQLVGVTIRTNNTQEMNPEHGQISKLAEKYWSQNYPNQILNRKDPGRTFAIYTEYDSDESGDYTYFLGEEVTQIEADKIPDGFRSLIVPSSDYMQFTTDPGPIPEVIITAWRKIWLLGDKDFDGKRAFQADLEVIDVKGLNPEQAVFDIFIGIQ